MVIGINTYKLGTKCLPQSSTEMLSYFSQQAHVMVVIVSILQRKKRTFTANYQKRESLNPKPNILTLSPVVVIIVLIKPKLFHFIIVTGFFKLGKKKEAT